MSSATRIARLALLAASLLLVACAKKADDGGGDPYQGGPESCLNTTLVCGSHASCGYDADAKPTCLCDPGYYGDGTTCLAVEECPEPSPCSENANCLKAGEETVCSCKDGFTDRSGTGEPAGTTCVDVDECTGDDPVECPTHATCQNLPGTVACVCVDGYAPDATGTACVIADRCVIEGPDACHAHEHCVNVGTDFACVCDARFTATAQGCVPAEPVGAGLAHGCALAPDGTVACWGRAGDIALGAPRPMGAATGFVQLSDDGTCAFRADGTLWCWWYGLALEGQELVVDWRQVGGAGGWMKTVAGTGPGGTPRSWGTRADGTIWSWDPSAATVVPMQVGNATDWTDVCPGTLAVCGTRRDGTAWCWSAGAPEPVQVGDAGNYVSLSCADDRTCGLRADGRADCWWPYELPAETEDGDPTLVVTPFALRAGVDEPTATVIDDVVELGVGGTFVCALREAGGIWCAGGFGAPALGLRAGDPLVPNSEPWLGEVAPGAGWRSLATGGSHACAVRHDDAAGTDTAFCWGANDSNQLGTGGAGTMSPVPVTL